MKKTKVVYVSPQQLLREQKDPPKKDPVVTLAEAWGIGKPA